MLPGLGMYLSPGYLLLACLKWTEQVSVAGKAPALHERALHRRAHSRSCLPHGFPTVHALSFAAFTTLVDCIVAALLCCFTAYNLKLVPGKHYKATTKYLTTSRAR